MRTALLSTSILLAATAFGAAPPALVIDATWDRFSQHTELRYTHLGTQTRIESTAADKPDPYLLIDVAQDQRITVYRHNSSWRLDPLEPKPRAETGTPGRPALPQPPPGIGPQGPIGPRTAPGAGSATLPPTPGYGSPAGQGPSIPQSAIRDPQSPAPTMPAGIGPRIGPGTAVATDQPPSDLPARPEMPPLPSRPRMPGAPGYGPGARSIDGPPGMPPMSAGAGPQPGFGAGVGMAGPGMSGMGMPPPMPGREQVSSLVKTEETQPLLGRTAVKYTITSRMMETIEIWAVPDADFGSFFSYRPQPPHRFGPVDLQDQWDGFIRREKLFPLLVIFRQGDREIARFSVTAIGTREVAEPAAFFAPPPAYYKCPPDPF